MVVPILVRPTLVPISGGRYIYRTEWDQKALQA